MTNEKLKTCIYPQSIKDFLGSEICAECPYLKDCAVADLSEITGKNNKKGYSQLDKFMKWGNPFIFRGIPFQCIPEGYFLMGAGGTLFKEHLVSITESFYLSETPITQEQYSSITGRNPSERKNLSAPVTRINMDDAVEFCRELSKESGINGIYFSLPTEAQWEHACKGDKTYQYYIDNLSDFAWYGRCAEIPPKAVGQKQPNAWGLHDMLGNVWEWCADSWYDYTDKPEFDPFHKDNKSQYGILRGGSIVETGGHCTPYDREKYNKDSRYPYVGFRVALKRIPF